jgi:hypothetical protein
MIRRTAVVLSFVFALSASPLLARHNDYGWARHSDRDNRNAQKRWAKEQRARERAYRRALRADQRRYQQMLRNRDRYDSRRYPYRSNGYRWTPFGYQYR